MERSPMRSSVRRSSSISRHGSHWNGDLRCTVRLEDSDIEITSLRPNCRLRPHSIYRPEAPLGPSDRHLIVISGEERIAPGAPMSRRFPMRQDHLLLGGNEHGRLPSMEHTFIILAIALAIHAAVVFLLVAKYLETRFTYVAWWTAGATMLGVRAGVEMVLVGSSEIFPLMVVRSALLLAGAAFFLTGTASRDPRARGIIQAGLLGFGVLVFAAVVLLLTRQESAGTARLIAGFAAGVAFLLAAEAYRRTEQTLDDPATRTVFAGLLAIGLNLIGWAWIERTATVSVGSEFAGGLAMGLFGAGIEFRALGRAQHLVAPSPISPA